MQNLLEANLEARQRRRLERARADGYLDARCPRNQKILNAYGRWCWRLKLPLVWFERQSPHSRFGRIRLDLFTTAKQLNPEGQAEIRGLAPGAVDISPHDAIWSRVRIGKLEELAARVLRAALKAENCETTRPRLIRVGNKGPARLIELGKAPVRRRQQVSQASCEAAKASS